MVESGNVELTGRQQPRGNGTSGAIADHEMDRDGPPLDRETGVTEWLEKENENGHGESDVSDVRHFMTQSRSEFTARMYWWFVVAVTITAVASGYVTYLCTSRPNGLDQTCAEKLLEQRREIDRMTVGLPFFIDTSGPSRVNEMIATCGAGVWDCVFGWGGINCLKPGVEADVTLADGEPSVTCTKPVGNENEANDAKNRALVPIYDLFLSVSGKITAEFPVTHCASVELDPTHSNVTSYFPSETCFWYGGDGAIARSTNHRTVKYRLSYTSNSALNNKGMLSTQAYYMYDSRTSSTSTLKIARRWFANPGTITLRIDSPNERKFTGNSGFPCTWNDYTMVCSWTFGPDTYGLSHTDWAYIYMSEV